MANTEVLKVSLKDYKKQIDDLKAALLQLDASSEEYAKTTEQIKEMQDKLNSVLGIGKKDTQALAGSYNALAQEMSALKKEWKATNDEAKRNELGAQILDINNKLKDMDASTGNFQRNVGAYEDAWKNAFTSIGGGAVDAGARFSALAKGGLKGLTSGFKSLWVALGPVGLIITAIVTTFKALTSGINSSEENTRKFAAAMAPLQGIMDGVQSVLQMVASGFVTLVGWIGQAIEKTVEFLSFIPGFDDLNEKIKTNTQIVEQNNKVQDKTRQINKENAALEEQMAEYMATYSDRTQKMTTRTDALNKANTIRKQIAENNLKLAKEELELIKLQSINTDNNTEANDKLAEAEAKVAKATADVNKALRENNEALKSAKDEQKSILSERKNATLQNLNSELNFYKKYEDEWIKKKLEYNNIDAELAKEEIQSNQNLTNEQKAIAKERIDNDKIVQDLKDKFVHEEAIRAEKLANIQNQLNETEEKYGKNSRQYQDIVLEKEKMSKDYVSNFAAIAATELGLTKDRVTKILDLEHYEEEQKNNIVQQQKVFNQQRIKDLENYYDTEVVKTDDGLEKIMTEIQKYEQIKTQIEKNLGKVNLNMDEVINFDPLENGKVNTKKYNEFLQQLIDANVVFPEEDLAAIQKRFATYNNNLNNASEAKKNYLNDMSMLAPEIENIQKQINTSIFGSTVKSDLEYELETTKQLWENLYQELGESNEEFQLRKLKAEKKYTDSQKKMQQQQLKNATMVADATANVFNTIATARQSDIQRQVDEGKISEEEGKKQFERTKALQYSSTWINTLSAIAQIMADSSIPSYWVKVPLAAAQLAEGIATTQQIKNTQLGSAETSGSNGKGSGGVTTVNVTPLLDEARDTMAMTNLNYNMNQETEQRVYVVESDIKQVGTRVDVREQATTF